MSWPRNNTLPWLGSSWPVSILKNVLFPAPFGPIRQRSSPSASVKLTSLTALTPPKCIERSRVWSSGAVIVLLRLLRLKTALLALPARAHQRLPEIDQRRHQSLRDQQHKRDEDDTEDQGRVGKDLRPQVRAAAGLVRAERGTQPLDSDAADHRTDQRAASADNDPDDDLRRLRQAEDGRADKISPIGEQAAGKARQRASDDEGRKLVSAGIISEKLRASFVLADADDDAAELARQQKPQSEIGQKQRAGRQIEHPFQVDHRASEAGKIERRNAGNTVKSPEPRRANMEFRSGGGVHGIEQDQCHRQRDDPEIDVADPAVEHEIAEQGGKGGRQDDREQKGNRALADVEHRDRVSIGAKSEESRLAEAKNAAIAPDQGEAEREDRHDHIDGQIQSGVEFGNARSQHHEGEADDADQDKADEIATVALHRPLRKKRPVIPCGSRRIRTIAAASKATSPNTGVVTKVAIWLMVPNSAEADTVPLKMAAPPPITVMKDLAT